MVTTIQISSELLKKLQQMKMHEKESYENIIWDMVEDRALLSEETKKAIVEYEKDVKEKNWKNFATFEDMKKRLGVNV
jgi:predicted CopG family antitoxin